MRTLHAKIVLVLLAVTGCTTSGVVTPGPENAPLPVVSSQAFAGIIVPRLVNFPDSWTPSEEQVILAEPKVQQCVISKRPSLRLTLSRYFRQYSGGTFDGRKVLLVSFLDTREFDAKRLRQPLVVLDGDDDTHFGAGLDLESGTCTF
jgi:hypothetical protein